MSRKKNPSSRRRRSSIYLHQDVRTFEVNAVLLRCPRPVASRVVDNMYKGIALLHRLEALQDVGTDTVICVRIVGMGMRCNLQNSNGSAHAVENTTTPGHTCLRSSYACLKSKTPRFAGLGGSERTSVTINATNRPTYTTSARMEVGSTR